MPTRPPIHKPARSRNPVELRDNAQSRGYDVVWQRARLAYLAHNPLCEECSRHGVTELANEVDHIVPLSKGGARLDPSNLQSLCKPCHSKKTRKEGRR
jgi:5-methylcytosine-specific restriction protein A